MKLILPFLCLALFGIVQSSVAEPAGGAGRGGAFLEFHTTSLSSFDSSVSGNPIVFGGEGFSYVAKNFRLGGGGGVAFLMNSSNSTHFGMGYGGVMAEYSFTAWLSIGLMIGGGAYAISTVNSGSDASSTVSTVSADGFLLVKPDSFSRSSNKFVVSIGRCGIVVSAQCFEASKPKFWAAFYRRKVLSLGFVELDSGAFQLFEVFYEFFHEVLIFGFQTHKLDAKTRFRRSSRPFNN